MAFANVTLPAAKASGIVVLTAELVKALTPAAERAFLDVLRDGLRAFLDQQFIDPTVAAVAGTSPGSITNGITGTASSGDPAKDLRTVIAALGNAESIALLMSPANAAMIGSTGALRDLGPFVTIVTSTALADNLVAVDASAILIADDGGIEISLVRHAALQMDSAPATPPATMTSLWQENKVGIKVERFINWQRARASAVALVTGADYAGA
jgi:hypothetical protein